ncbi:MAG: hypothetical protein QY326_07965 [Bdellovibrionota bacterium]|nr:MAG: hypothetical protein QY326_07965 [Bdellovibrionota bacterium]
MAEHPMSESELGLVHHYVGQFMAAYLGGHQDRKTVPEEQIDTFIQLAVKTVERLREWEKRWQR